MLGIPSICPKIGLKIFDTDFVQTFYTWFTRKCKRSLVFRMFDFDPRLPRIAKNPIRTVHRRRIELKDKPKVVASVWGTESLPR